MLVVTRVKNAMPLWIYRKVSLPDTAIGKVKAPSTLADSPCRRTPKMSEPRITLITLNQSPSFPACARTRSSLLRSREEDHPAPSGHPSKGGESERRISFTPYLSSFERSARRPSYTKGKSSHLSNAPDAGSWRRHMRCILANWLPQKEHNGCCRRVFLHCPNC